MKSVVGVGEKWAKANEPLPRSDDKQAFSSSVIKQ